MPGGAVSGQSPCHVAAIHKTHSLLLSSESSPSEAITEQGLSNRANHSDGEIFHQLDESYKPPKGGLGLLETIL